MRGRIKRSEGKAKKKMRVSFRGGMREIPEHFEMGGGRKKKREERPRNG